MDALLFLILCLCFPSYFGQSVTQNPAAVTKKECQSVSINCVFNSRNSYHYFKSGSFFRKTREATEWERISGDGRFVVSVNKAQKAFSLEIRDLRIEDTATYYCKAQYYRHNYYVDGSGSVLNVIADSNSLVSQSPPLQTSAAGDTVTLSCDYSGFDQYTVYWYSQSPGHALKYLLQGDTSGKQRKENAAGGRISASIDPKTTTSRLMISQIQLNDSAVYYCARSRCSAHRDTEHGESSTKTLTS
ncbi:Ig heavy chain Mem5-like [Stegostoma tigrinum]|uniref:Ig heavy chain Mem5-like n=1 Tax=Stegostoma tigrinum TaxID=3053191 RepID=UPI00286FF9A4|nr:Ig heavy chain Mem5-like [Stegostoma tigrinum]